MHTKENTVFYRNYMNPFSAIRRIIDKFEAWVVLKRTGGRGIDESNVSLVLRSVSHYFVRYELVKQTNFHCDFKTRQSLILPILNVTFPYFFTNNKTVQILIILIYQKTNSSVRISLFSFLPLRSVTKSIQKQLHCYRMAL